MAPQQKGGRFTSIRYDCQDCEEKFTKEVEASLHHQEECHTIDQERVVVMGETPGQTIAGAILLPIYLALFIPYTIYRFIKRAITGE